MNNILIVTISSYAGMGPYAASIINSFYPTDNVYFWLGENESRYYSSNVKEGLRSKSTFTTRKNSTFNKLKALFFKDRSQFNAMIRFCETHNIDTIHFLTVDMRLAELAVNVQDKYHIVYTVHDLHPHEQKKVWYKEYRMNKLHQIIFGIVDKMNHLVTNSREQYQELLQMYPNKRIDYFEFPTLVTDTIAQSTETISEIESDNYVLFFGRIELYKGIHLAYEAFANDERLKTHKLVIAGGGDIYWERDLAKESNITIINRYIKDEEIKPLYEKARVALYPYLSATQSGVISIATYFGKPILASDVPFFRVVQEENFGQIFRCGDASDLVERLVAMLADTKWDEYSKSAINFYQNNYDPDSLRMQLYRIYNQ